MDTLFPKIRKPQDAIVAYRKWESHSNVQPGSTKLDLVGSVKLHGTHADVVIMCDDRILFQSRNATDLISRRLDNYGFSTAMVPLRPALLELKRRYYERYKELNPETPIKSEFPLIMAGEWIGEKIQNKAAITALSRRFVIVSVSINGSWLPDEDYKDIADEEKGIFNVSRAGYFHETIDLNNYVESIQRIQEVTEAVDKECPFAKTFGVSGCGEGIVWKIIRRSQDPSCWFKTKGYTHTPGDGKLKEEELLAQKADATKAETIKMLVGIVITGRRLEQGLEYLREFGYEIDESGAETFADWVVKDGLDEEHTFISSAQVDEAVLTAEIHKAATAYYLGKIEEDERKRKEVTEVANVVDDIKKLSVR